MCGHQLRERRGVIMLPAKMEKQFEMELQVYEADMGGQLTSEQYAEVMDQKHQVELICDLNHDKFESFKDYFEECFSIPLDKFWKDDYNAFMMKSFAEFLMDKYPDWTEYAGPGPMIRDKIGSECDDMLLAFCDDPADKRDAEMHLKGLGDIKDVLDGKCEGGFDVDDLPPELREQFGL
jgi:hypothetical protein